MNIVSALDAYKRGTSPNTAEAPVLDINPPTCIEKIKPVDVINNEQFVPCSVLSFCHIQIQHHSSPSVIHNTDSKKVLTYAFLDSHSDSNFILKDLVSELSVDTQQVHLQ